MDASGSRVDPADSADPDDPIVRASPGVPAGGSPRPAKPTSYAPLTYFLGRDLDADRGRRIWTPGRLGLRLRSDAPLLLSIAIAIPVLIMQAAATGLTVGLLAPLLFVAAQVWLATLRTPPRWLFAARLWLTLAFIASANFWADPTGAWPLTALAVPVVALAAAIGGRGPIVVALAGMALILAPLALPSLENHARQEVSAVAMAAVVVALGSRRVVADLQRSSERLRRANQRARRRARELTAVETVGRLLARDGPTPAALDQVMGLLEKTFGYRYPSVYIWDGAALQLGAERNYRFPIQTLTPDRGVLGRVVHSREPAFLPDARSDPDFLAADPSVVSEIAIALESETELLGVLNVETSGERRLDEDDLATMQIVGDRLAAALALGRERQKLTERTDLLDRLTIFATVLGASLDPASMDDEVAAGAAAVISSDMVVLVHREESTGEFLVSAVSGGDRTVIGQPVKPGEGVTGRAIALRSVVVVDQLKRSDWPKSVSEAAMPDVLAAMSAPATAGDKVVGAVSWFRSDLTRPFSIQEREVAQLLASKVGLALANARLHQQTHNAAITDPLTGIHNRRHFDAAIEREDALRRRIPAERRRLRSAILFDLDHFGRVNKRFGHQVGDRVLRLFADTLRARARASDLVARYGGEEFVVVLENATRDEAAKVAEEVRVTFGKHSIDTGTGAMVTTTVSAGCASLEPWEVDGSVLLERADVALAMAKAAGRDKVVAA